MEEFDDYYGLLGLSIEATVEEIQQAAREKARRWRQLEGSPDAKQRRAAEEGQEKLDAAKKVLLNPQLRQQYDAAYAQNKAAKSQQDSYRASGGANASGTAQAFMDDAWDYFGRLEFGNALRAAQEAYKRDAQNSASLYLMAVCEAQLDKVDDAYFHINQALRLDNTKAEYWAKLGEIDDVMQKYGKAEAAFKQAATLDPNNSYYEGRIAWAKSDQGAYADAFTMAQALLVKYPNDDYAKLAYSCITNAYITNVIASNQDGIFSFTNTKQIETARNLLNSVKQLGPNKQAEVNHQVAEISDMLDYAEKRHFNAPSIGACVKAVLLYCLVTMILFAFIPWLGLVVCLGGLVYAVWYVLNDIVPYGWQANRKGHTTYFNQTGIQG